MSGAEWKLLFWMTWLALLVLCVAMGRVMMVRW